MIQSLGGLRQACRYYQTLHNQCCLAYLCSVLSTTMRCQPKAFVSNPVVICISLWPLVHTHSAVDISGLKALVWANGMNRDRWCVDIPACTRSLRWMEVWGCVAGIHFEDGWKLLSQLASCCTFMEEGLRSLIPWSMGSFWSFIDFYVMWQLSSPPTLIVEASLGSGWSPVHCNSVHR